MVNWVFCDYRIATSSGPANMRNGSDRGEAESTKSPQTASFDANRAAAKDRSCCMSEKA